MRFEEPVLLYGAGREAVSSRAFLRAWQPDLDVFVTVDDGKADIADTEVIVRADLSAAIRARRFGVIVKSPGVSQYKPILAEAVQHGIRITSNLNLWGAIYRTGCSVIAITGTKGKSTTATLTHLMLVSCGIDAGLAGNVGVAPLDIADRNRVVVLELSSYQAADMDFLPDFAGLTNLTPEHVDWHGSVDRYYTDKLNLFSRPGPVRVALGHQAETNSLARAALGSPDRELPPLSPDVVAAIDAALPTSRLKGAHNRDNAQLAARLAFAAGANLQGILAAVAEFRPLPHRLEEHEFGALTFVDDSIATTPEATKAALAAYRGRRIALVAGGHERQQDYSELARLLASSGVTTLICLPVTGERLARASQGYDGLVAEQAPDLESAMLRLCELRDRFDTVILSPGAPSYNQFRNFEERGDRFVSLAQSLFPSHRETRTTPHSRAGLK